MKSIVLSSNGIKNIIGDGSYFTFIFDSTEIRMNSTFAEFISPRVTKLHQSDPTISQMQYCLHKGAKFPTGDSLFTENLISILNSISQGSSIQISYEESKKLRLISILLGNDELFNKINELYPEEFKETNMDDLIDELEFLINFSEKNNSMEIDLNNMIDIISTNFASIDQNKLQKLPKSLIFSILSNEKLKIESEDSLFEFILKIYDDELDYYEFESDDKYSLIDFLEIVEIKNLSDDQFSEFLSIINPYNITTSLWNNLCHRFENKKESEDKINKQLISKIKFDGVKSHAFKGIIHQMTKEAGGNVNKKGIVSVTSSSTLSDEYSAENAVDINNKDNFFVSNDEKFSWLMIDFKVKKVRPSYYSIRSAPYQKDDQHLRGWTIEGSNTGNENDWEKIDSKTRIERLNDRNAYHTFQISPKLDADKFYRFIRIKQTSHNANGDYTLMLSAIEFFGAII